MSICAHLTSLTDTACSAAHLQHARHKGRVLLAAGCREAREGEGRTGIDGLLIAIHVKDGDLVVGVALLDVIEDVRVPGPVQ